MKAGNACILKGGREAEACNLALQQQIHEALGEAGLPADAVQLVTGSDREEMKELLQQSECIDLVIPRGGTELIRFVHEHSAIPTVQHFHGVCHVFVHRSADLDKALDICVTGKTSAPATCNATEAILVDADVAAAFVPRLVERFAREGVEVHGDARVQELAPGAGVVPAGPEDWGHEFLDLIVAVRVVQDLDAAIEHVREHGSNHTDAIVAEEPAAQQRFVTEVQSSCTIVNASTRFNDGFQLGLGAEIGISTSRVHAFGPMGLEELTTQRYVAVGDGQCR
jgi:glutamate-5-semialdehyde dehydrogenase